MDDKSHESEYPTPIEATDGEKPLQAEFESRAEGIYPPDISPAVDVGGSPEEQNVLEEEFSPTRQRRQ